MSELLQDTPTGVTTTPAPEVAPVLPEADQAPIPDAPAELTAADAAGIDRLNQPNTGIEQIAVRPRTVSPDNTIDLRDQSERDAQIVKAQKALASSQSAAGMGTYTDGPSLTPAPEPTHGSESDPLTVDHPLPTENHAGQPFVEQKVEKKKGWLRGLFSKEK